MHQNSPVWKAVKTTPVLIPKVVHLYQLDLQSKGEELSSFWKTLSADEQHRANQFHFEVLRNQYITCRGTLRKLLGYYLRQSPESLRFSYSEYGKPILETSSSLQFNVSHTADIGLIAFTLDADLGVDIEAIKKGIEVKKLTQRFFSKNEAQYILDLPTANQDRAFFKCWTRKEAFIKGHGQGLSLPLDQFEVSISDQIPTALRVVQWDPASVNSWSLRSFNVGSDKLGAIAVKSAIDALHYFNANFTK